MAAIVLIVAGLALLLGALVAWPFLQKRSANAASEAPAPAAPGDDLRQELEARYRTIAELDEDLETGKISAADHARLKADMERAAAGLLARLEALERTAPAPARKAKPARAAATAPPAPPLLSRPPLLIAGAILCLAVGVAAGLLIPRVGSTPAPVAARRPAGPPDTTPAGASAELGRMEAELQATPNDVPKLLTYAHRALDEGQMMRAIPAYKHVLELDPKNTEALTHFGTILAQAGHFDQALQYIDRALAIDPKYAHAHWDKANVLYDGRHDYRGAIKEWEAFLEVIPTGSDADRARTMIEEAKARALAPAKPAAAPTGGAR